MTCRIASDYYGKLNGSSFQFHSQLDLQTRVLLKKIKDENQPPLTEDLLKILQNTMEDIPKFIHPQISKIENIMVSGPNGPLNIRLYSPYSDKLLPVFVFFHGGGWVLGSLDEYDHFCQEICRQSPCIVASIDYHLAPQYKFPKPLQDCYAATKWVFTNIHHFGGDPHRVAIGGDSAGGNLASALTLMNRDSQEEIFEVKYQVLIFPVVNHRFNTPSYEEFAEGYYLTRETMQFFWSQYLDKVEDGESPYASPLKAFTLSHLPPALVILANCDPLFSEGLAYASRLTQDHVPVEVKQYNSIHGFINFENDLDVAHEAMQAIAESLNKNLN